MSKKKILCLLTAFVSATAMAFAGCDETPAGTENPAHEHTYSSE